MNNSKPSYKLYKANDTLFDILEANGLREFGNSNLNRCNKRTFKQSKSSTKNFYVDQGRMKLCESSRSHDEFREIPEEDIKLVLMFFGLKASDLDELMIGGQFKLKKARERLQSLTSELQQYQELRINYPRRKKIERIIRQYEEIQLCG